MEHYVILPTVHTKKYAPNNPKVAPMPRVDGDLGPCTCEQFTIRAGLKVYERENFLATLHRTDSRRHLGRAHNFMKMSLQYASREGVDHKLDFIPDFCPCKSAFVENCDRLIRKNARLGRVRVIVPKNDVRDESQKAPTQRWHPGSSPCPIGRKIVPRPPHPPRRL